LRIEDLSIPDPAKKIILDSGIRELYPPQEEAIGAGALEGKNLVLASPTASGKTLVAELCAVKHVLENDGKVLYLTPLRALASEKFQEFRKYTTIKRGDGRRISVGISTGDFDSSDPWLARYDIIIMTNEKCDSLLRHKAKWLENLSLVVADEIHLLNDADRGPTLEVVLARLRQIGRNLQLLVLSATIRNSEEVAEWLQAVPITTEWRPVMLREGVLLDDEMQFKDGGTVKIRNQTRNQFVNLSLQAMAEGGQALVFASTRKNAVNLAKKAAGEFGNFLSKPLKRSLERVTEAILTAGERTRISELLAELARNGVAFHHAGLSSSHRRIVEDAFREGRLKVLAATPTLAFGVNLPARMVIISDYRRYEPGYGYYPISVLEYKQMVGRAGRPRYDKVGESVLIAKTDDERDYLFSGYVLAQPERIWSRLGVEKILRSHVLATIASDFAHSEQGVYDFFSRTFYAYQYDVRTIKGMISNILKFLYEEKMIDVNREEIYPTTLGRRVSQLYIDPVSAITIREAFVNRARILTDMSFLLMVAHTPDMFPRLRTSSAETDGMSLFADEHRDEFMFKEPDEWADRVSYEEFLGEIKTALVLKSWIEEVPEDEIIGRFNVESGDLYRLVETAKWLLYASRELALLLQQKDLAPPISKVMERVEKGIKEDLLPLVKLEGIGRVRARILYNAGYRSIDDLKKAQLEELTNLPLIGPRIAKRIKEQIGGYVKSKDWEKVSKAEESQQQALTEYY